MSSQSQSKRRIASFPLLPPLARPPLLVTNPRQAMFVHLPDVAVVGSGDMTLMVSFIAQSIMLGMIGLLPDSCRR